MTKSVVFLALAFSWGIVSAQERQPDTLPVQPSLRVPSAQPNRPEFFPGSDRQASESGNGYRERYIRTNRSGQVMTNGNIGGIRTTNLAGLDSTNNVDLTNRGGLAPTSDRGATNRVYGTNNVANTNLANGSAQDRAVTAADRRLLVQIRQAIHPMILSGQPWAPVHFVCNQGVVMVVGEVPDIQQKQQLVTIVSRTPGVVRVVDDLQINVRNDTTVAQSGNYEAASAPSAPSAPQTATITQDQSFTVTDRNLVGQLHEAIQPVIGNAQPWSPVHFICRNGTVTLVGFVPNDQQKQQIVTLVQQTPGVVRVIDQLQVNVQASTMGSTNAVVAGGSAAGGTNTLAAGSRTNISGMNTNLIPTGRTNDQSRRYQDDDRLPPGLEKRRQLPPGLDKREGDRRDRDNGDK